MEAIEYIRDTLFSGKQIQEVSDALGYTSNIVGKVFRGERKPSTEFLLRSAMAAHVRPEHLFELAGAHDLARRFSVAYPSKEAIETLDADDRKLVAQVRQLAEQGLASRVRELVKELESRLERFKEMFTDFAASTQAASGFVAISDHVVLVWRCSKEAATSVVRDPPKCWFSYGDESYAIYLKKPKEPENIQVRLLLEVLRGFS